MSTKLSLSYRQSILERHEAGQRADETLRSAILSKIELTRQTGQLIADACGDLRGEQFDQATDFLSKDAVRSYLKFAHQNPEPITDLENALHAIRLALQVSGGLTFPDGHGPQKLHKSNFYSYAENVIQNMSAEWHKFVRRNPLKNWRVETLESFVATLTPIEKSFKLFTLN